MSWPGRHATIRRPVCCHRQTLSATRWASCSTKRARILVPAGRSHAQPLGRLPGGDADSHEPPPSRHRLSRPTARRPCVPRGITRRWRLNVAPLAGVLPCATGDCPSGLTPARPAGSAPTAAPPNLRSSPGPCRLGSVPAPRVRCRGCRLPSARPGLAKAAITDAATRMVRGPAESTDPTGSPASLAASEMQRPSAGEEDRASASASAPCVMLRPSSSWRPPASGGVPRSITAGAATPTTRGPAESRGVEELLAGTGSGLGLSVPETGSPVAPPGLVARHAARPVVSGTQAVWQSPPGPNTHRGLVAGLACLLPMVRPSLAVAGRALAGAAGRPRSVVCIMLGTPNLS